MGEQTKQCTTSPLSAAFTAPSPNSQIYTKTLGHHLPLAHHLTNSSPQITADSTPGSWPATISFNPMASLVGLFLESMKVSVELVSDEMPEGRYKLIHSVGGAASVKVNWNEAAEQYTGLFK